ncbi:MAG: hypothetical protein RLZZ338_3239 [Cyanobacteriota bacterium]|jgi:hypothetical protein
MLNTLKRLTLSASVVAVSAIVSAPSFAGSLTNPSLSGVAGTDYYIYQQSGNKTVLQNSAPLSTVLQGDAGNPGGNVELFANSETVNYKTLTAFRTNVTPTSLTGQILGTPIVLSSLTYSDWFNTTSGDSTEYGAANLATTWFKANLVANGYGDLFTSSLGQSVAALAYNTFLANAGFQRFSDPNISYINQDSPNGVVKIGLAGHYDATGLLLAALGPQLAGGISQYRDSSKVNSPIQMSEVVKVVYGEKTSYLYSFRATPSGLTAADDGISHNGNYEVTLAPGTEPVPEPMTILGMALGVSSLVATKRQQKNA